MSKRNIKEIAQQTGLSTATVSRILNDKLGHKPETILRVKALARELECKHSSRKKTVPATSKAIGVIVHLYSDFLDNNYTASLLNGITAFAAAQNYTVMLLTVTEETCNLDYIRKMIAFYRLQGVILPGNHFLYHLAKELGQLQVPAVTINTKQNPLISDVSTDSITRGEIAAKYLLNKGHTRLGIIAMADDDNHQQICRSFIETAKQYLPSEKILHWEYKSEKESIIHAVNTILHGSEPPTALYFVSSDLVRLFYPLILNSNLRIPEDISILSSEEKNELQGLGITTFIQPTRQIGETAVKLLLQQCCGQSSIQNEIFPCKLRERSSVSDRNSQHNEGSSTQPQ